jgi:hypothetical protein
MIVFFFLSVSPTHSQCILGYITDVHLHVSLVLFFLSLIYPLCQHDNRSSRSQYQKGRSKEPRHPALGGKPFFAGLVG